MTVDIEVSPSVDRSAMKLRFTLTAQARLVSPLHVGGIQDQPEPHVGDDDDRQIYARTLARRHSAHGAGVFIPGTSLAGALRSWYERRSGAEQAGWLFGDQDHASLVDVSSATVDDGAQLLSRPSVGIDRYSGTAARGVLYARESVAAGSTFSIKLLVRAVTDTDPQVVALRQLNQGLQAGEIQLGASASRGLGQFVIEASEIRKADLSTIAGLTSWFESSGQVAFTDAAPVESLALPEMTVCIQWKPISSVLVAFATRPKHTLTGDTVDVDVTVPIVEPAGGTADPDREFLAVLPGSSIKGALRSRACRIANTVQPLDGIPPDDFLVQLDNDQDLVKILFGSTEHRGALTIHDVCSLSGLAAGDARELRKPAGTVGAAAIKALTFPTTHVAIDRWTGGAAHGKLFRVMPPQRVTGWQPIKVVVDLDRLRRITEPEKAKAALCLLGLVLAEFSAGTLPLGSRVTRGLGAVDVQDVDVKVTGLGAEQPNQQGFSEGRFGGADVPAQVLAYFRTYLPANGWSAYLTPPPQNEKDPNR